MIGRLNHVAIAVPDLAAAAALYRDALGAAVGAPQPGRPVPGRLLPCAADELRGELPRVEVDRHQL